MIDKQDSIQMIQLMLKHPSRETSEFHLDWRSSERIIGFDPYTLAHLPSTPGIDRQPSFIFTISVLLQTILGLARQIFALLTGVITIIFQQSQCSKTDAFCLIHGINILLTVRPVFIKFLNIFVFRNTSSP